MLFICFGFPDLLTLISTRVRIEIIMAIFFLLALLLLVVHALKFNFVVHFSFINNNRKNYSFICTRSVLYFIYVFFRCQIYITKENYFNSEIHIYIYLIKKI